MSLLGVGPDLSGIRDERVGRAGWFGGLGGFVSWHLLPMLFDECDVGPNLSPRIWVSDKKINEVRAIALEKSHWLGCKCRTNL